MTDEIEEPGVMGAGGGPCPMPSDEELKHKLECLGELIKVYAYFDVVIRSVGSETEPTSIRVFQMGDVVPSDFVQFYDGDTPISNDDFLRFASNVICFGQEKMGQWLIIPTSFGVSSLMSLNLKTFREHGKARFETRAKFLRPVTYSLIETNQMSLFQLLRNIVTFPLNIFRDVILRLKDRSFVS